MAGLKAKWEDVLKNDPGLQERLRLLDGAGNSATRKGDLICLSVKGEPPLVVSWDGSEVRVEERQAKKPFCSWQMDRQQYKTLFLGDCPPLLVAMNRDQANIKIGSDHHHGALVVSFMVMLQECGTVK